VDLEEVLEAGLRRREARRVAFLLLGDDSL
jgi:hypothetical protein